jgi:hypothetical protein
MDPTEAQSLGLVPPADPGGAPAPSTLPGDSSSAGAGLLDIRRALAGQEEGSPPAELPGTPSPAGTAAGTTVEERLAVLEQENQKLRTQIEGGAPEDPIAAAQVYSQQKTAEIDQQALAAYYGLLANEVAQGEMTQAQAQREVQNLRASALAQVRADAQTIATLPATRLMLAQKIAKESSVGDIKITVDDILPFAPQGPEAMRVRALTLQEMRRDHSFKQRAERGTDRAEAGASGASIDPRVLDQLSPGQVIKLGIQRGHFS